MITSGGNVGWHILNSLFIVPWLQGNGQQLQGLSRNHSGSRGELKQKSSSYGNLEAAGSTAHGDAAKSLVSLEHEGSAHTQLSCSSSSFSSNALSGV